MPKRAILDVDATLWDMWGPVVEILEAEHNVTMGTPDKWEYHRDYVTDDQFYAAVRQAHENQVVHEPYSGAQALFRTLDEQGYEVIVASHRPPQSALRLVHWLSIYKLAPYTGIYAGRDKHFLFQIGDLVIDDRPDTIKYAHHMGAQALSLTYKYNWSVLRGSVEGLTTGNPIPRGFHTLEDMAAWIQKQ